VVSISPAYADIAASPAAKRKAMVTINIFINQSCSITPVKLAILTG